MRADNAAFNSVNQSLTKKPRYVVEIAFDIGANPTDLYYFTSHNDAATPDNSNVTYNVVNKISGTSQKLDVLNARATIGSVSFKLQDYRKSLTTLINSKLDAGFGLREKRVRFYIGDPVLAWPDYQLITTQLIQSVTVDDKAEYTFRCSDLQRVTRKDIFDLAQVNLDATLPAPNNTALTANVDAVVTTFSVKKTTGFTAPGSFIINNELCRYTGVTATTFTGITRGVNGTIATSHLGNSSGDAVITEVLDIVIPVTQDNSGFELLEHGTSYGDAASQTVGYLKLDDEIIRYYSKADSITFTDCIRGALQTKAVEHEVDAGTVENDRKPKIDEYVYLEMPILKLALALLTGDLDGQPGETLPQKWHLGIDPGFVATSKYLVHKDLYDPGDDTLGFIVRFEGVKKTDGKRFLEKEIYALAGGFGPVLSDGQLSFRRQTGVLSDAHYVKQLDHTNIISTGMLKHDMDQVTNQIEINWNWNELRADTTRESVLVDTVSFTKHQDAPVMVRTFRGLHGSIHSTNVINKKFNALRNRYSGPPLLITPTGLSSLNNLEIGDHVKLTLDNVPDFNNALVSLDRTFEVQQTNIDWLTGKVRLSLFGSSQKASATAIDIGANFLANAYYTATGTNIETAFPAETNVTGGVLHIIANITLVGNDDIFQAIYYTDKPLQLDNNVTLTYTKNVFLKVLGHYQIDYIMNGAGQGLPGAVASGFYESIDGTSGYIGNTQSAGAVSTINRSTFGGVITYISQDVPSDVIQGIAPNIDVFELTNVTSDLLGLPDNLQGTSGSSGGGVLTNRGAFIPDEGLTGGDGGAGGAGLIILARGISHSGSGLIRSNGADGAVSGNSVTLPFRNGTFNASSGAGGAPGGVMLILDGDAVPRPDENTLVEALHGATPIVGNPSLIGNKGLLYAALPQPIYSVYPGFPAQRESRREASSQIYYVPKDQTPTIDIPEKSQKPIAIIAAELPNTPPTVAQNLASIEITVTPPNDTTYDYTNFYAKKSTDLKYTLVGSAAKENVMLTAMDGTTFDIRAKSVSIFGEESDDFVDTTITVSNQTGGAGMVSGNFISAGQTAFDTGIGLFLEATATGGRASFGDSNGNKVVIEDGNVTITGTIDANSGNIGGWKITANTIENANGRIKLDNANNRIRVENLAGTNYVDIDENGITGFDSVLGETFSLPTDGSAPTFSSGIINQTLYNISTSGILRTSDTVGDGSVDSNGVLINDTGIKVFQISATVPSFYANANDGTTIMGIESLERFAKFDGLDFLIGRDTELLGAEAYNNNNIYIHEQFENVNSANITTIGAGSSVVLLAGALILVTGLASGDRARYRREKNLGFVAPSWAKKRRFRAIIQITNGTPSGSFFTYVGLGDLVDFVRFRSTGLTLVGECGNSSGVTNVSLPNVPSGLDQEFEMIWTPGANATFYIDGNNEGSVSSNLPSGGFGAKTFLNLWIQTTAIHTFAPKLESSEVKIIQEKT